MFPTVPIASDQSDNLVCALLLVHAKKIFKANLIFLDNRKQHPLSIRLQNVRKVLKALHNFGCKMLSKFFLEVSTKSSAIR